MEGEVERRKKCFRREIMKADVKEKKNTVEKPQIIKDTLPLIQKKEGIVTFLTDQ